MFDSDEAALQWCENNPELARASAAKVVRRYIEAQRAEKKKGGKGWVESWQWEDAYADVLQRPKSSELVTRASSHLRTLVSKWRLEEYDDSDNFERLLDRFIRAIDA